MKNTSFIALLPVVVLFVGIGGLIAARQQSASPTQVGSVETVLPTSSDLPTTQQGKYLTYSAEVLSGTTSSRRVLFFFANWCPTCKPADASFTENVAQIPNEVAVFRVNYNDTETDQAEKDLAKKYDVTYQHTFVQIDEQGNAVKKWNGGGLEELLENLQ